MILFMSFLIGIAIPSAFIYLKEILRTKINSLEDLEKITQIPIISTIPIEKNIKSKEDAIVVKENTNNVMTEAFRTLRANLQFLLQDTGKVIMFTSTNSGEGKTFISCNFAISQAILGKKVLLMGLDIRRPRLAEVFNFSRKKPGITSYLMGNSDNTAILDSIVINSGVIETLDLIPAGIVPPNPAELLAKNNLKVAMEYFSKKYDYIILDTAPLGLVSDSIMISKVADLIIFVTRCDHTEKADIALLNSLVEEGKIKNASMILNAEDIELSTKTRRSRLKYGYSYYGYSDTPNK